MTWYNVGEALLEIKQYAAAAAYLTRHVQLNAWGSPNGSAYQELGAALVNLKRADDACVALQEGIAKFPFNGQIWYELALAQAFNNDNESAAYSAAVAFMAGLPQQFIQEERDLRARLEQGFSDKVRKDLETRTRQDAVRAKLSGLVAESNKARQARTIYMTPAFITYALAADGPTPDGAKDLIPQELEKAPSLLAPDETPVAVKSGYEKSKDAKATAMANADTAIFALRDGHFTKPAAAASPRTYFRVIGIPGNPSSDKIALYLEGGGVSVMGTSHIASVIAMGWNMHFAPPVGDRLAPGEYANPKRWPFNSKSPGMDVGGMGQGVTLYGAKFVIWELNVEKGKLTRLAVDFTIRPDEKTPPMCGIVRYNSLLQ